MKHNPIIIISVFLANWEIVQTVDNSSRTDFGECAAILQVFIPTTKKQGIYYCVAKSNVAVLRNSVMQQAVSPIFFKLFIF